MSKGLGSRVWGLLWCRERAGGNGTRLNAGITKELLTPRAEVVRIPDSARARRADRTRSSGSTPAAGGAEGIGSGRRQGTASPAPANTNAARVGRSRSSLRWGKAPARYRYSGRTPSPAAAGPDA